MMVKGPEWEEGRMGEWEIGEWDHRTNETDGT